MIKYIYIIGIVALTFLIFWFLRSDAFTKNAYKKATVSFGEDKFLVDVADSAIKKAKGLSGRKELSANEGMLFIFSPPSQRTFWMKNMLIPIDIIWINEGVVVGIENQVDPEIKTSLYKKQRYSSPERVDYVLEIAGGRAEELNIQKGSKAHISFK